MIETLSAISEGDMHTLSENYCLALERLHPTGQNRGKSNEPDHSVAVLNILVQNQRGPQSPSTQDAIEIQCHLPKLTEEANGIALNLFNFIQL